MRHIIIQFLIVFYYNNELITISIILTLNLFLFIYLILIRPFNEAWQFGVTISFEVILNLLTALVLVFAVLDHQQNDDLQLRLQLGWIGIGLLGSLYVALLINNIDFIHSLKIKKIHPVLVKFPKYIIDQISYLINNPDQVKIDKIRNIEDIEILTHEKLFQKLEELKCLEHQLPIKKLSQVTHKKRGSTIVELEDLETQQLNTNNQMLDIDSERLAKLEYDQINKSCGSVSQINSSNFDSIQQSIEQMSNQVDSSENDSSKINQKQLSYPKNIPPSPSKFAPQYKEQQKFQIEKTCNDILNDIKLVKNPIIPIQKLGEDFNEDDDNSQSQSSKLNQDDSSANNYEINIVSSQQDTQERRQSIDNQSQNSYTDKRPPSLNPAYVINLKNKTQQNINQNFFTIQQQNLFIISESKELNFPSMYGSNMELRSPSKTPQAQKQISTFKNEKKG